MGVLDKLKFWKKKEPDFNFDSGFGSSPGSGFGQSQYPGNNTGLPFDQQGQQDQGFGQGFGQDQGMGQSQGGFDQGYGNSGITIREIPNQNQSRMSDASYTHEKNMEIISSKLDAIKAGMEAINQRLANLERIAQDEGSKPPRRRDSW